MCVSACVCERSGEEEQEGERKWGREGKKERKTWAAHVEAWIPLVEVQSFSLPCGVVRLKPKSSDLIRSTSTHWNISQIQSFILNNELYQVKTQWNKINILKYFPVIQMRKSAENYNFPNHRISTNMHYMIYTCMYQLELLLNNEISFHHVLIVVNSVSLHKVHISIKKLFTG